MPRCSIQKRDITVYLPVALFKQLEDLVAESNESRSDYIANVLQQYIDSIDTHASSPS